VVVVDVGALFPTDGKEFTSSVASDERLRAHSVSEGHRLADGFIGVVKLAAEEDTPIVVRVVAVAYSSRESLV